MLPGCFCGEIACSAHVCVSLRVVPCPPTVRVGDSQVGVGVNGSGSILPRMHSQAGDLVGELPEAWESVHWCHCTISFCGLERGLCSLKKMYSILFSWGVFVCGAFMGNLHVSSKPLNPSLSSKILFLLAVTKQNPK